MISFLESFLSIQISSSSWSNFWTMSEILFSNEFSSLKLRWKIRFSKMKTLEFNMDFWITAIVNQRKNLWSADQPGPLIQWVLRYLLPHCLLDWELRPHSIATEAWGFGGHGEQLRRVAKTNVVHLSSHVELVMERFAIMSSNPLVCFLATSNFSLLLFKRARHFFVSVSRCFFHWLCTAAAAATSFERHLDTSR